MRRHAVSAICAGLLVACCAAYGQESERDRVVLTTGNRLHGEIVELARGELTFFVDGAGPVGIDWRNVASLTSVRVLDVELATGERMTGSILSPSPGQLAVAVGTRPSVVATPDVIRITPLGATPAERTSGHVEFGLDFLSANDERDLTFNAQFRHRSRDYLTTLLLASLSSEFDGQTAHRRNYFQVNSRRLLRDRWFAVGRLHAEADRELGLDARLLLGFGGGRLLLQSNRSVVALYGGLAGDRERYRDIAGADDTAEAFVSVEWERFELGGSTMVSTNATMYFSVDSSRRRIELDANLRRSIVGNVYWSVRVYESYDSDVPPGLENSDRGATVSIGRVF